MAIQIQGNGGTIAEVDGSSFRALRTANRPLDVGALGHYQVAVQTGAIAAGMSANGELLHFRWTDSTRLAVIHKITINGMRATTAFAVGVIDIKVSIARAWTADGTGGTLLTMTGNNQKMRTSMGSSLVGTIRIATTAALGAGTKTLDTQDIGLITTHSSGGVGSATPIIGSIYIPVYDIFEQDVADLEHPVVLAQNEGLVVRATVPGTGVWNLGVMCKWSEVAAF